MKEQYKYLLNEKDIPKQWYNIVPELPNPLPPQLNPKTMEPIGPEDLLPLFPMGLILQEVSEESYIDIPEPVLELYKLYRPSPMYRALRLEKALGTKSRIYYKYEGGSPSGSHKPNTAIPQAFYNAEEGIKKMVTETGAGQWGSALSFACQAFGIELEVFQVSASFESKPHRKTMMEIYGATVHSSPSERTDIGKQFLKEDPETPGSLGIAISEAIEVARKEDETRYALGSVLNHVLMHQSIIGLEAIKQMELAEDYPDVIVGCTGGGSNFTGLFSPFARNNMKNNNKTIIRAVEPQACPSLTKGTYTYDFGDSVGMAPVVKMHTLGSSFIPDPIHAGGLRYHGMAPLVSAMYEENLIEAEAIGQKECFEAGQLFTKTEGIVPAPEATHAVKGAVDAALECKKNGEAKSILFNLCGHGHFDMKAYGDYFEGNLAEDKFDQASVDKALEELPKIA